MKTMMADESYIIFYPTSVGEDFNNVLFHHVPRLVDDVEEVGAPGDVVQR